MDRAEAVLKKNDDDTSTAGRKDTFTSESMSPTGNEKHSDSSSPYFKGFPGSSSLSPISPSFSPIRKVKRLLFNRTMDLTGDNKYPSTKKRLMNSHTIPKKRNVQQRIKTTPESKAQLDTKMLKLKMPLLMLEWTESVDQTPYLVRLCGLRKPNVGIRNNAIITGDSGLTNIAPRNLVCYSPDTGRLAHQENMKIPQPHQSSQPSSSSSHFHSQNAINHESQSSNHLKEQSNRLENMDSSTPAILERYKNRVTESTQSKVMRQLVFSGQGTVNKSAAMSNASHAPPTGQSAAMEVILSPPEWFENFVSDFKKHELWKLSKILKMQQELVDLENYQLSILKKMFDAHKKDNS